MHLTLSRSSRSEYLLNCWYLAFFSRTTAIVIFFLSISSLKHFLITSFSSSSSLVTFPSSRKTRWRVVLVLPDFLFFFLEKVRPLSCILRVTYQISQVFSLSGFLCTYFADDWFSHKCYTNPWPFFGMADWLSPIRIWLNRYHGWRHSLIFLIFFLKKSVGILEIKLSYIKWEWHDILNNNFLVSFFCRILPISPNLFIKHPF